VTNSGAAKGDGRESGGSHESGAPMIMDARHLAAGSALRCDICIVGSGAAGLTLAHALRHSGLDIILLEAGGEKFRSGAQDPYKGQVADPAHHGALHEYRHRRLGGTTAVWGGRCAPFAEIDFECRPHVPHSGWPLSKPQLDPFYERANIYCQCGEYAYDATQALSGAGDWIRGFRSDDVDASGIWRFSPPTHFGKVYRQELAASPNVRILLHANCLRLLCTENGSAVESVEAASAPGRTFCVTARRVVLACGGLEVARLLLTSDQVHPNGIGNDYELVGRFYISHMTGDAGEVEIAGGGPALWAYEQTRDGVYCRRALTISAAAQRRERLLNFRAILSHSPVADPRHGSGVLSAMYLMKRCLARRIPPEYSRAFSQMRSLEQVAAHCHNIGTDALSLARFSLLWARKRLLASRKLPSVMIPNHSGIYTLHFDAEQRPNRESRVTLCAHRDAFGIPRLRVDWRFTSDDVSSVARSCRLIGNELERTGAGRLLFDPDEAAEHVAEEAAVGSHHIGTARMSSSPREGVVDSDCRVYGMRNLFIASSAVFPTSGFANPTLTIVALAIRLADHLSSTSSRRREAVETGVAYAR
jgi:choline dehydrogenase-like flavoprotein